MSGTLRQREISLTLSGRKNETRDIKPFSDSTSRKRERSRVLRSVTMKK